MFPKSKPCNAETDFADYPFLFGGFEKVSSKLITKKNIIETAARSAQNIFCSRLKFPMYRTVSEIS
jgi:hypothetical protein